MPRGRFSGSTSANWPICADLSLPTIQRMEASDGVIRGNVDSLMKLVAALDAAGIELIAENAGELGRWPGCTAQRNSIVTVMLALSCVAAWLAAGTVAVALGRAPAATPIVYGVSLVVALDRAVRRHRHTCSADRRPSA